MAPLSNNITCSSAPHLLTDVHQLLLLLPAGWQQAELVEQLRMAGQLHWSAEGAQGHALQVAQPQPGLLQESGDPGKVNARGSLR